MNNDSAHLQPWDKAVCQEQTTGAKWDAPSQSPADSSRFV